MCKLDLMQRRTFIKIAGIATAISVTPWVAGCASDSKSADSLATPQTLGTFCTHEELVAIGKTYCEMNPDECNQSSLEEHLLSDGKGDTYAPADASSLTHFLSQKVAGEFANGDLAIVKGWVLSRTEARQIALYSLLS
jgi:hypothetical protein